MYSSRLFIPFVSYRFLLALLCTGILPMSAVYAAAGSLDTGFGTEGIVITPVNSANDVGHAVVQQIDGKLVVAGSTDNSANNDFVVARYNSDGTLDTGFGTGGKVTTDFGGADDEAFGMVLQPDGELVVAGYSFDGARYRLAVARYTATGMLDVTFSGDGKLTTDVGLVSTPMLPIHVIVQTDDHVVVSGWSYNGSNTDFVLVRYNVNGSLDAGFGIGGIASTAIGSGDDGASAVIQQTDNKLVAAGWTNNGADHDFAIVRYNTDGTLDTTFGTGGKVTTAIGSSDDDAFNVIQQEDGMLVAVGKSNNGSNTDFALVRYNTDGTLDTTFDVSGIVTTNIASSNDEAYSVVEQPNGKLVVAGFAYNATSFDVALVRYKDDGGLDTVFGTAGITLTDLHGTSYKDSAYALLQQTNGRLVIAGAASSCSACGNGDDMALVRYFAGDSDGDNIADELDQFPLEDFLLRRVYGDVASDYFGLAVANAGDVDKDGYDDVLVGAYQYDVPTVGTRKLSNAGEAKIISGQTGATLFTFLGSKASDYLGYAVAGVGDVDGDTYPDVAVGAYQDDKPTTGTSVLSASGSVKVYSGHTGALLYTFWGDKAGDNLGKSVAAAGDVNKDGTPDIVAGMPGFDVVGKSNAGAARVYSGVDGTVLSTYPGVAAGDSLGLSVAGAGDVDKDTYADIIAGAPMADHNSKTSSGSAYVFSGLTSSVLYTFDGDNANDLFGFSVSSAGDVNTDGNADLIVGAYQYDKPTTGTSKLSNAGEAKVFSGVDGAVLYTFTGTAASDYFGMAVGSAADVDGDGTSDLIVGAPQFDPLDGSLKLASGGAVYIYSGQTGSLMFTVTGENPGDFFGRSVASCDLNADTFSDVIVGAYQYDKLTTGTTKLSKAGAVYIINGKSGAGL